MTRRLAKELSLARKLLLATVGIAAVAGPIVFGLMNAPPIRAQSPAATNPQRASFDVASIKQNHSGGRGMTFDFDPGGRFVANNVTLKLLLQWGYGVKEPQISGGPGWINSERYNIEAKPEDPDDQARKFSPAQWRQQRMLMIESLLADRFKLTLRHETKELTVYALVVAKSGPKIRETAVTPTDSASPDPQGSSGAPLKGSVVMRGRGQIAVNGAPLGGMFVDALSLQLGRVVLDKTGLKGNYDFTLNWTPDENQGQVFNGVGGAAPAPDAPGPSIFTALEEQLGLKLESQKGPVDTLMIDHVERPSEN